MARVGNEKSSYSADHGDYLIVVNGTPSVVPLDFYARVHVDDIVEFDGTNWIILKYRD